MKVVQRYSSCGLTDCFDSTVSPVLIVLRSSLAVVWRALLSRTGAAKLQATRAARTVRMIGVLRITIFARGL